MKIKDWYTKEYMTDSVGFHIKPNKTFLELSDALDNKEDVYKFLGVGDSLIRERIFSKLAEILEVDYEVIYNKWLKS